MSHWDYKPIYRCRLPHWQPSGAPLFITWRLYGSLPQVVISQWEAERAAIQKDPRWQDQNSDWALNQSKRSFSHLDELLHQYNQETKWLARDSIAELVQRIFHAFNGTFYTLYAYVIMPNHVHILLLPLKNQATGYPFSLAWITQRLKGGTAREANLLLNRTGELFWAREFYDHWARNPQEMERIAVYIANNPVKANLVNDFQAWPWTWISNDLQ